MRDVVHRLAEHPRVGPAYGLGAGASNVLRLVLSRGLLLTTTGIVIGVALALFLTRLLGDLLYQESPRDPLAFAAAFAVMTVTSTAACFFPAWRATRTDPMRALRAEWLLEGTACSGLLLCFLFLCLWPLAARDRLRDWRHSYGGNCDLQYAEVRQKMSCKHYKGCSVRILIQEGHS
jgi:hypothetical protein